jgi:CheY-like chemotaxis protein
MRVLLVEDKDDLRRLFARVLRNFGCGVVEAADGASALGAVAGYSPELIVTDIMMPGMDGVRADRPPASDAPDVLGPRRGDHRR